MPDYVLNQPSLTLGLELYLNAWFELDWERRRVRGERIRRSSVWEYGRDFDLSYEQTEDLWFYVSRMDGEFLDWYAEHMKGIANGKPK